MFGFIRDYALPSDISKHIIVLVNPVLGLTKNMPTRLCIVLLKSKIIFVGLAGHTKSHQLAKS